MTGPAPAGVVEVLGPGLRLAVEESRVTPGVLGFLVVALLGGATYLLIRSMNRQIRRIDLPDDATGDGTGEATGDDAEPGESPDAGPPPR